MGPDSVAVESSPSSATAPPSTVVAATALAPGFRFHPTDEELVSYYLKRKVLGKPVRFDAIGDADIYKYEPWDLAAFTRLKTRDQEWYFYCALDKKYGNGARMNRSTNIGYWKATGRDREIRRDVQLLGMKKTLVFHSGRAPDGLRTNWVMHEYRLVDYETESNGNLVQDAYVLVKVFHKNNIGPPCGNRYAPFLEEEWADDGVALIPGVVRAEPLPLASGNNQMDQETQLESKELININETPREVTPMDIEVDHQNQLDNTLLKPQENNNNNNNNHYDEDEKALKREHADEEERSPPAGIIKEAPSPLLHYKRRRQNESNNSKNSSGTTQDHCSSTTTTLIPSSAAAAAATSTAISALLEFSLMDISKKKENTIASPPTPLPTHEEKLNDLQKEIHEMSVERESFKLEMMSAEAMISILQSRIDALRQENDELKKNSSDKGQATL